MTNLPSQRLLSAILLVFAVTLAAFTWTLPRSGIDFELHPAYQEASRGGWDCIFSLDRLSAKDVQLPYAGWPIFHPLVVCLLGKMGLGYWVSIICVAGLSALISLWLLVKCMHLTGVNCPLAIPAAVFLLNPGLWVSMGAGFAHVLLPLGAAISIHSLVSHIHKFEASEKISLLAMAWTIGSGFLVGHMNWACFMVVPAAACAALITQKRLPDGSQRRSFRLSVLKWTLLHGIGLVTAFIAFKLLQKNVVFSPESINEIHSGNMDRFLERTTPNLKNLAGMIFFNGCRLAFVVLPLLPLLVNFWKSRKEKKPSSSALTAPMFLWTAVLSPVVFSLLFSGEIGQSAHTFHGRIWVFPATVLACFLASRTITPPIWSVCLTALGLMLVSNLGYKVLAPIVCANPTHKHTPKEFLPPGSIVPTPAPASLAFSNALRTFLKQGISSPMNSPERRSLDATASPIPYLQNLAPALAQYTSVDDVIICWSAHPSLAEYVSKRCFLSVSSEEISRAYIERVVKRIGPSRLKFLVPADSDISAQIRGLAGLENGQVQAMPENLKLISF